MRKLCALLLCTALLIPSAQAAPAVAAWPQWAEEALAWGQEREISGVFLSVSTETVSRGMAAQLLYEAAGCPATPDPCPFSGVTECADAVTWTAGHGYLAGVGSGLYAPDRPVTRQEFAVILWRQACSPAAPPQGLDAFQDAACAAEWAGDALLWCLQVGVISGRSEDQLVPLGQITVAEALVMLQRCQAMPDVSGIRQDLEVLAAAPRPIGSQGEADAVRYLKERFEEMGYAVALSSPIRMSRAVPDTT